MITKFADAAYGRQFQSLWEPGEIFCGEEYHCAGHCREAEKGERGYLSHVDTNRMGEFTIIFSIIFWVPSSTNTIEFVNFESSPAIMSKPGGEDGYQ